MLHQSLRNLGLTDNQIKVYIATVELGNTHAGAIVDKTHLARATTYDTLEQLIKKGLIHKYIRKKTTYFSAEPPEVLEHIIRKQEKEVALAKKGLDAVIDELNTLRNARISLPKVRMYEGREGVRSVMEDTLTSREIILAFTSFDKITKDFLRLNFEYMERRAKKGVYKHALIEESEFNVAFLKKFPRKCSEIRFFPNNEALSHIEMNVYDGKVSYFTYRGNQPLGVIIEDEDIYQVQKAMFEEIWKKARVAQ